LKTDGTVVVVGCNFHGQNSVSNWRDIIAIDTSDNSIVSVKADGTVVVICAVELAKYCGSLYR